MGQKELLMKVQALRALKDRADELTAQISALESEIKGEMEAQETERLDVGAYKVLWTKYTTQRFDAKAMKAELPEIYKIYTRPVESRRFSIGLGPKVEGVDTIMKAARETAKRGDTDGASMLRGAALSQGIYSLANAEGKEPYCAMELEDLRELMAAVGMTGPEFDAALKVLSETGAIRYQADLDAGHLALHRPWEEFEVA